ncbi:MAG TPA: MBOAT family O-acyltransferase [Ilumatobacteraceae bacterium]|nr:MBOAT family O-acyltransferase [Ilumatobacteraceae bacterium]
MLFSSPVFLTVFLPIVLGLYFVAPTRLRNAVLLVASLVFYAWGSGVYVLVLMGSGLVAWLFGARVHQRRSAGASTTSTIAAATIVLLAPLIWFKYASWFSVNIDAIVGIVGISFPELSTRNLPIGISFFTFQAMSYVFDVNRAVALRQRRFRDFLLYLALFPQLIAGPIVRYQTVADQLTHRISDSERVTLGLQRFVFGLAKKVIVADSVGSVATAAFASPNPSTLTAWIGAVAFALQIYFDFSGYSDMAIGLGKVFGFDFPENFRRPYSALSITDFWRRWHITLSEWFRDYVYIPLGGNRVSTGRQYVNLITVFFLTALWHGAAWTFMVWGGLHAAALIVERVTGRNHVEQCAHPVIARTRTAFLVVVFWVFFRAEDLGIAQRMLTSMFTWQGIALEPAFVATLTSRSVPALIGGSAVFLLPREPRTLFVDYQQPSTMRAIGRPVALACGLIVSFSLISTGSLSPFLYFQF